MANIGALLFLVHINDLTEKLHSNPKPFADDTFLFSTVTDETLSNSHLNDDLTKINDWAYKWKMRFNLDSTKPTHEVVFSRKNNNIHSLRLHLTSFLLSAFNLTNI